MLARKTSETIRKQIVRNKRFPGKEFAIYLKTTYWVLFMPVFSYEEFFD